MKKEESIAPGAETPTSGTTDEGVAFYRSALGRLMQDRIPFLVGGAYALRHYTGINRDTKDLDIFTLPKDCERALAALAEEGFRTELTDKRWLGKAFGPGGHLLDIIFNNSNGLFPVDDLWFAHSEASSYEGVPVRACPAEEILVSKSFVMERERYDGADVAHLILKRGARLDWKRILVRFGPHWEVLLSHLIVFRYSYPSERHLVPKGIIDALCERERSLDAPAAERLCRGTLISRNSFLIDTESWGFESARDPEVSP